MKSSASLQKLKKVVNYGSLLSRQTSDTYLLILSNRSLISPRPPSIIKLSLINFFLTSESPNKLLVGGAFYALVLKEEELPAIFSALAKNGALTAYLISNGIVFSFGHDAVLSFRALSTSFFPRPSILGPLGLAPLFVFSSLFKLLRSPFYAGTHAKEITK